MEIACDQVVLPLGRQWSKLRNCSARHAGSLDQYCYIGLELLSSNKEECVRSPAEDVEGHFNESAYQALKNLLSDEH